MKTKQKRFVMGVGVLAMSLISSSAANAVTFKFDNIFPTSGASETSIDSYVQYFSMDVTEASPTSVLFQFNHLAGTPAGSRIATVYIDGTLGAPTVDVGNVGDVDFSGPGTANFPQGNKLTPAFGQADQSFDAVNGAGNKWAVQSGETLGISFVGTFSTIIASLLNGTLRVGFHVTGIGTSGYSDSIINLQSCTGGAVCSNDANPVPVPGALPLLASGLGLMGYFGWRKGRKPSAA